MTAYPTCGECGAFVYHAPGPRPVRVRELCRRCATRGLRHIDVDGERVFCAYCWKSAKLAGAASHPTVVFDRFLQEHVSCEPGEPL